MIITSNSPFAKDISPAKAYINSLTSIFFIRCQGSIIDESGNNRTVALNSDPKNNPYNHTNISLKQAYNQSLSLTTTGLLNNLDNGFSISFWFNSLDLDSRDIEYSIFSLSKADDTSSIKLTKSINSNKLQLTISEMTNGDIGILETVSTLTNNTSYHIAFSYDKTNNLLKIYVNGVLDSQLTLSSYLSDSNRSVCSINGNANNSYKDIALFNSVLTLPNIQTIYDLTASIHKLYGYALSDTAPAYYATCVLVRMAPDGDTVKVSVNQTSGYWEYYASKDYIYDVTAYSTDGQIYKPQIYLIDLNI
jgi:hypothetical protein